MSQAKGHVIECRRPCGSCAHVHIFLGFDDDAEICSKCGADLSPIATEVTELSAAADRLERALVEDQEALACWCRIDDAPSGEGPVVRDIAERLARAALTGPMVELFKQARISARVDVPPISPLFVAARAFDARCAMCGSRSEVFSAKDLCRACTPMIESEAALSERCRKALAAFDGRDPRSFKKATQEIIADRPGMTVVEFFERALGKWDPSPARKNDLAASVRSEPYPGDNEPGFQTLFMEAAARPQVETRTGYTTKRLTAADAAELAELLRVSLGDQHLQAWHPRLREIREKMIERLGDIA